MIACMNRNFACWRSAELDPDGRYSVTIESFPKSARRKRPSESNSRLPIPVVTASGSRAQYMPTPL
jgi:hypothetical protein